MKTLSLGLAALIVSSASVFAHGNHAHSPGADLTHAAQGPGTLTIVVVGSLAAVGIITLLIQRLGR